MKGKSSRNSRHYGGWSVRAQVCRSFWLGLPGSKGKFPSLPSTIATEEVFWVCCSLLCCPHSGFNQLHRGAAQNLPQVIPPQGHPSRNTPCCSTRGDQPPLLPLTPFLPNSASNSAALSGLGRLPVYKNFLTPNGFRRRATACPRSEREDGPAAMPAPA